MIFCAIFFLSFCVNCLINYSFNEKTSLKSGWGGGKNERKVGSENPIVDPLDNTDFSSCLLEKKNATARLE